MNLKKDSIEGVTIEVLTAEWDEYLDSEKSPATVATYQKGLYLFMDWLSSQGLDLRDVKPSRVRDWRNDLHLVYSRGSVNIWLTAVRRFYAWLIEEKDAPILNPAQGVKAKGRASSSKRRDMLTSSEIVAVLETCDNSKAGLRDKAILGLMAYAAVRSIEIHRADLDHLETKSDRLVLWVHGKGAVEPDEFVVISHYAEDCIRPWLAIRGKEAGSLFISLSNRCRGKRLGLRAIRGMVTNRFKIACVVGNSKSTHSLRHSAITSAILHGATPQQAQAMARHKSIDTTLSYYHQLDRLENPAEDLINYSDSFEK